MGVESVQKRDLGPDKVYTFLSRTGFLDTLGNQDNFKSWMSNLTFEDFKEHLVRLNGLVRGIRIKDRKTDGENVSIQNFAGDVSYSPPEQEEKELLLKSAFESAKSLDEKDAGLLLYLTIQAAHPFADGNGRTGRLLYLLMEHGAVGEQVEQKELKDLLTHEGDSGPGREKFAETVKSPQDIYESLVPLIAQDSLGEEFMNKFWRLHTRLQVGAIEGYQNEKVSPELKSDLDTLLSNGAGGPDYYIRDIALAKFLKNHNLLDQSRKPLSRPRKMNTPDGKEVEKDIFSIDGNEILSNLSESDAGEIVEICKSLRVQMIEKIIDVIAHADKYPTRNGNLKDSFLKPHR